MEFTEILFIVLIFIWVLERFVYVETAQPRKEDTGKAFLIKGLLPTMLLCAILASSLLNTITDETTVMARFAGLVFLTQGLLIRYWTYFLTKPYFSRKIVAINNRPLFSHGPFRFTRHPFHTGFFFIALGICLFISSHWISILVTFLFVGSALHYRMSLEESVYAEKYGDIYTYWCRHRCRLVPFIY
ncbi:protein-S-isoprenylcysteine O-methyltransferase Ste14 [Evansella vedderi]|uniref:Protein-S-isoprenylcysteine O-methyltransferase Ste14 n=1 Tax=Evansella vedderi TaxID=38282 RepID=A0ABT9ZTR5_9BACI|nr:isoprenylcysteine carboxylmethyltransferase family protein [Evansella vedderi]MDQ0254643.1 protein-S-isoprenylcysteine O-methyltransferase Ste14 [Evansella vedderi]